MDPFRILGKFLPLFRTPTSLAQTSTQTINAPPVITITEATSTTVIKQKKTKRGKPKFRKRNRGGKNHNKKTNDDPNPQTSPTRTLFRVPIKKSLQPHTNKTNNDPNPQTSPTRTLFGVPIKAHRSTSKTPQQDHLAVNSINPIPAPQISSPSPTQIIMMPDLDSCSQSYSPEVAEFAVMERSVMITDIKDPRYNVYTGLEPSKIIKSDGGFGLNPILGTRTENPPDNVAENDPRHPKNRQILEATNPTPCIYHLPMSNMHINRTTDTPSPPPRFLQSPEATGTINIQRRLRTPYIPIPLTPSIPETPNTGTIRPCTPRIMIHPIPENLEASATTNPGPSYTSTTTSPNNKQPEETNEPDPPYIPQYLNPQVILNPLPEYVPTPRIEIKNIDEEQTKRRKARQQHVDLNKPTNKKLMRILEKRRLRLKEVFGKRTKYQEKKEMKKEEKRQHLKEMKQKRKKKLGKREKEKTE